MARGKNRWEGYIKRVIQRDEEESEKEGLETGEVVGLAVKRRISRAGKNRGTEDKVDSFETKCHLSSALTLSQSVNHERKIRETQMLGFAEYQMKPNMVNAWKQTQQVVLDLYCQLLVAITGCRRASERWLRGACSSAGGVMTQQKVVKLLPLPPS